MLGGRYYPMDVFTPVYPIPVIFSICTNSSHERIQANKETKTEDKPQYCIRGLTT